MPMCGCTRLPCPWTHRYRRQRDHFVPSSTPFLARFGLEALATVRVEEDTGTVPRSVTGSVAFRRSGLSSSNGRLVRNRPFAHSAKFSGHKGAGKAGRRLRPQHRVQGVVKERTRILTGTAGTSRPSPRNGVTAYTYACVCKVCQNVRTGGSDQPPVAGSEPEVLEGHRACRGAWDRSGVFLNPNSCKGFEPVPSKEGSWMMAQNDLVVAGIDVAKDKVDVCIRSLSQRRVFPGTAEGRRKLIAWLRRYKVDKAVMEASGGYERDWAKALRESGIEVRIVDPKRVRSFARSAGRLAKNDSIDADMIAWF